MANDSSSGGPLFPLPNTPPVLEGQDFMRFLQQWLSGVSGLAGSMVRPRWQPEPANIPDAGTVWAAIGISDRASDDYPTVIHHGDGDGYDELLRHETLELLMSFYDLGTNGEASFYATQTRDGLAIAQNLEPLELAGMNLISTEEIRNVPSLLKSRWLFRVDLPIVVRRCIQRFYPVRNILSVPITVTVENPGGTGTDIIEKVLVSVPYGQTTFQGITYIKPLPTTVLAAATATLTGAGSMTAAD